MSMNNRTLILNKRMMLGALAALAVASASACSPANFGVAPASEEFAQSVTYAKDVDVLWMIDTSTSMDKHQNLLAAQMGIFVDSLNETGLNYQVAVTTMDMGSSGEKGRFVAQSGTPAILTAQTPDLKNVLSNRLRLGANGSPVERGQEALKAALTAPNITTGANKGFLRPNSLLVVVFLSDEEDQSANQDYAAFLDEIRPPLATGERSWVSHVMGVMPNDPSCTTAEWGYSSVAYRYMSLATASGGVSESICDADLRRALTNVKARILEIATEYKLDRKPIVSTIQVVVNGQPVPKDSVNGWSYIAEKNSIRFHGNAVPKPGSGIRVNFDPEGLK